MKSQTPSTKLQTNLKFQYSMTKRKTRFGFLNFGHCDLFGICDLLFKISCALVLQTRWTYLPGKPLDLDLANPLWATLQPLSHPRDNRIGSNQIL
jgi:hypothetical protein